VKSSASVSAKSRRSFGMGWSLTMKVLSAVMGYVLCGGLGAGQRVLAVESMSAGVST
jgi:hypothetical protein